MKRWTWYLVAAMAAWLFVCGMIATNSCTAEPATPAGWIAGAAAPAAPAAEKELKPGKLRDGLTIRERRAMGLTLKNVRKVLADMQEENPDLLEDATAAELAVAVASELVADNPQAFQDPSLDWDAILEFLERLIPLILQLISIFS